jgi:para-nitrobenzyl esterase
VAAARAGTLDQVSTATSVTVSTAGGAVQGVRAGGVVAFLGIPYAAAPVGERRFRAPEPAPRWSGARAAVAHGPTAPMPGYPPPFAALLPNPTIPGDEYLNLSVWTPAPDARGLPVLVWIHGGAFVNGSSAVPLTDGSAFARDGVVTVALNYRLGVEGFALLPDAPPNLGLLDQVAALEWVRDNVAAFGGDPDEVTVIGESSGAMSIGALLAMPRATGLFRRAVLQSGAAHHTLAAATAGRVADYLAAELGVPATAAALRSVPIEQVIRAQKVLTRQLQAAPDPARWGEIVANIMMFEPVVDGEILPGPPWQRIAAGSAAGVDVLVGANRHEHRFFLVPTGVVDQVDTQAVAAVATACRLPDGALDRYRHHMPDASPGLLLAEVMTDWFYRIPALRLAESNAAHSHVYEFAWESPAYDGHLGACHALELPFVFDSLHDPGARALVGTDPPAELAATMRRAWTAFATTGDPGWPAYTTDRRAAARFGSGAGPGPEVIDDPRGDLRELWDGIR